MVPRSTARSDRLVAANTGKAQSPSPTAVLGDGLSLENRLIAAPSRPASQSISANNPHADRPAELGIALS
jgi:hypothetical protein